VTTPRADLIAEARKIVSLYVQTANFQVSDAEYLCTLIACALQARDERAARIALRLPGLVGRAVAEAILAEDP